MGRLLAQRGVSIVTGGLGGVMEAASAGFQAGAETLAPERRGVAIGIVPGRAADEANAWVDVVVATGLGEARNVLVVNTAAALIAVGGEYGTLSEVALALKAGKRVVSLGSWEVDPAVHRAATADEAVDLVLAP